MGRGLDGFFLVIRGVALAVVFISIAESCAA